MNPYEYIAYSESRIASMRADAERGRIRRMFAEKRAWSIAKRFGKKATGEFTRLHIPHRAPSGVRR